MNLTAEQILKKDPVVNYHLLQVLKYLHPEKVILFGSKATGKAKKGSDTDLAVETNAPFDMLDIIGAVDIVDIKTVNEKLKQQILEEGIVLYERKS